MNMNWNRTFKFALKKAILTMISDKVDTGHALRNSFYFIQDVLIQTIKCFV